MRCCFLHTFFIAIISTILIQCDKTTEADPTTQTTDAPAEDIIIRPEASRKKTLTLTPSAKEFAKDWMLYNTITNAMDSLQAPTVSTIRSKTMTLTALFNAQQQAEDVVTAATVPDTLQTNAIKARLLVVESRLRLLQDLTAKKSVDTTAIKKELTGLHNAFQELNLQLNERFNKSIDQLLREAQQSDDSPSGLRPSL